MVRPICFMNGERHLVLLFLLVTPFVGSTLPARANPVVVALPDGAVPQQILPQVFELGSGAVQRPSPPQSILPPVVGSAGVTPPASGNTTLAKMTDQSWGLLAASEAQALGVSTTALAATCVMESQCATNPGSNGTISGTFQMTDATYLQTIQEAVARDPSLSGTIPPDLDGKNDPAIQAIAASQYLYDGATALQSAGLTSPSFTDARAYFQFGPSSGEAIALADPADLVSSYLSLTPKQYAANGINPATTTIGQWRQSVTNAVGTSAASSNVLS